MIMIDINFVHTLRKMNPLSTVVGSWVCIAELLKLSWFVSFKAYL